jgi:cytochrome c peroxidase
MSDRIAPNEFWRLLCSLAPSALAGALTILLAAGILFSGMSATAGSGNGAAALGERLFFDKRLSRDGRISCGTCHQPDKAFTDGQALAIGVGAQRGTRNTPSLVEAAQQTSFFWDGRRDSLESQALDPLLNPGEHGIKDPATLLRLLGHDPSYATDMRRLSGNDSITGADVSKVLAAFQRTLVDGDSAFDRFIAGETEAMSPQAISGWQLFNGRAQCTRCHAAEGPKPLLTDHGFHSLRVGLKGVERRLPRLVQQLARLRDDKRTQDHSVLSDPDMAALGRFVVTLDPKDIGKFKTPSLRNVAITAPYMHDGSVPTLAEAVDLEVYYRSTEDGRPLILTAGEKSELVAFLESLTGWPRSPYMLHHSAGTQGR